MIQCVVCTRWFHLKCVGLVRTPGDLSSVICAGCKQSSDAETPNSSIKEHRVKGALNMEVDFELVNELGERLAQMETERKKEQEAHQAQQIEQQAKLDQLQQTLSQLLEAMKKPKAPEPQRIELQEEPEIVLQVPNYPPKTKPTMATKFGEFSGGNGAKQTQSSPNLKKGEQSLKPTEESSEEEFEEEEDFFNVSSIPQNPLGQNQSAAKKKPNFTSSKKEIPVPNPAPVSSVQAQTVKASNEAYKKQSMRPLPIFSGKNAKDWPAFINAYNYSTKKGPFDDEENTIRLREYVTGDAAEWIEGFLVSPVGAPHAIEYLREWFGDTIEIKNQLKEELLQLPKPKEQVKNSFQNFSAKLRTFVRYLIGMDDGEAQLNNDETIRQIVGRLPTNMQSRWYDGVAMAGRTVNLEDLDKFVTRVAISYKNVAFEENRSNQERKSVAPPKQKHKVFLHEAASSDTPKPEAEKPTDSSKEKPQAFCHHCQVVGHVLSDCGDFKNLNVEKRLELVRKRNLCLTCLRKGHGWTKCFKNKKKETPEHHSLLKKPGGKKDENSNETSLSHYDQRARKVLFRVVPVTLHGSRKKVDTFAIIDDCSSVTLLEQSVAEKLEVSPAGKSIPLKLHWTQNKTAKLDANKYTLQISGRDPGSRKYKIKNVFAVPNLELPQQTIDAEKLKQKYSYLEEAEIETFRSVRPTILIGLEHTKLGSPLQIKEGGFLQPIAMKTRHCMGMLDIAWAESGWFQQR